MKIIENITREERRQQHQAFKLAFTQELSGRKQNSSSYYMRFRTDDSKALQDTTNSSVADKELPRNRMVSTSEVAVYLDVEERALQEATARGDIKGHKFPPNSVRGEWKYWKKEVDQSMNRKPRQYKTKGADIY